MSEFDLISIKRKMLRKYPVFGSTISSIKYQIVGDGHQVKTSATDGKTIYCNESFLSKLSEDQQVFVFAHEVCHIALNHILRSEGKIPELWNIATDAVINQHLLKDGLPLPEGAVNFKSALEYDAEELYQKLLTEQKKQQDMQNNKPQQNDGQQQDNEQDKGMQQKNQTSNSEKQNKEFKQNKTQQGNQIQEDECLEQTERVGRNGKEQKKYDVGHDEHSMWANAIKEMREEKKKSKDQNQEKLDKEQDNAEKNEISEKEVFKKNIEEKIKRAEEIMNKLSLNRKGVGETLREVCFGGVGKDDKAVVNWKKLLQRNLEFEDEAWGHKFSDRASGYIARIEDVEYDGQAETEIILDTSGSVSVELLKSFLRQVKTILKNSNIKVGTFSNDFHGFVEIERESDIDNLKIKVGGGTNFDAASRAFSRKKDVNKICFTDGEDGGDSKIIDKRKDIIWVSFKNRNFKPDYGKVIYVSASQIQKFNNDEDERLL